MLVRDRVFQTQDLSAAAAAGDGGDGGGGARQRGASHGEGGMALILVVGAIAVIGVIAAHLAVLSEVTAMEAQVAATRQRLRYVAESAAEQALFLHLADRRAYANRSLGELALPRLEADDPQAWMADNSVHSMTFGDDTVQVRLRDADSGISVEGSNPSAQLRTILLNADADEDRQLAVERFLDMLADYIDGDDNIRLHGKESSAYAADGFLTLPRNAPLQLREEALWLEAFAEVFTDGGGETLRLIPPKGMSFGRAGKPAFFSADPTLLRNVGNFTADELAAIAEAKQKWFAEQIPLTDSLDPGIIGRLRALFNFNESGVTTVEAVAVDPSGKIRRGIRISRDCRDRALSRQVGGELFWSNWQYMCP